jgi:MbtH protein
MISNPFESETRVYLVLSNEEGQHSLWPAEIAAPAGWERLYGPEVKASCLAFVERNWTDMRPRSLATAMASDEKARQQ